MAPFQIFAVLTSVYGIYVLIRAVMQKREGALIFLIGFLVIVATTLNDILYSQLLIQTGYLIHAGLFVFIFLQAFLLSLRFSKAFAVAEDQRQALSATNRAYAQEIRDRQRVEAALADAQRIAHIGNWEWDMQTGTFHVSNEVARILGLAHRDTTYDRVTSMLHANDRTVWERAVRAARDEDTPLRLDVRMINGDDATRWIHSEARSIRNEDQTSVKMFGTFQDITERKQMEDELLKASKLESIGLLAGGLAHDFNNILTAIVGNVSLAKAASEHAGQDTQLLDEAERAAMRATALTRQLLTFSKGGAPVKQLTAIAELLRESVPFVLRGANVRSEFSIADDLWPAEVDGGQVTQVIYNLILNGVQAMPGGGVMRISAENVALDTTTALPLRPGPYVHIAVQDEGSGIREEWLPKIFDPYFTTKSTGNGLGLAMAYSIIDKHNGHITVATEIGVGTTFHVYLPAVTQSGPVEPDEARPILLGAGNVLVMDDEETIRELTKEMLHRIGYDAEVTRDGAAAVACYQRAFEAGEPFDAVILDLTVPGGMGGREALQWLLAIDPHIKAIVCSGYSNDPVMSAFQEYGFSYRLAKPYTMSELSQALGVVIAARRRQTSENA